MGIFSLFGKKHGQSAAEPAGDALLRKRIENKPHETALLKEVTPKDASQNAVGQNDLGQDATASERRQAAQQKTVAAVTASATATTLKIDAIESEMSSEFGRPDADLRLSKTFSVPAPSPEDRLLSSATILAIPTLTLAMTLEDVPLLEEAAILFANGQTESVEYLLKEAIDADTLGPASVTAWAMLLDLHQISGNRAQFDYLSIAFANRFETSPPAWMSLMRDEPVADDRHRAPAVPSVVFAGKLDASIIKSLEKARNLAKKHPAIRLEFARVTEVDPIGCGLLLRVLHQLKKSGTDLILVGGSELVKKIRAILVVGRRDETELPWLLLLELLAMIHADAALEEASIDYSITFEVSPPAFIAVANHVTTAVEETRLPGPEIENDVFVMPGVIEGRADTLIAALGNYVARHNPARVDCAALMRVDVNAASQLQAGLLPFSTNGRRIEFFHVNHLVAVLLNVIGLKSFAHISTRKI